MVSFNEKGVTFDPASDEIKEIPSKKKWLNKKRKNSKEELISDADPLVDVTFKELLLLNKPDWLIVLIGVISSAILGTLFPMMSILFSGLLDVSNNNAVAHLCISHSSLPPLSCPLTLLFPSPSLLLSFPLFSPSPSSLLPPLSFSLSPSLSFFLCSYSVI